MSRVQSVALVLLLACIFGMAWLAIESHGQSRNSDGIECAEEIQAGHATNEHPKPFWDGAACFLERTGEDPLATFTAFLVLFTAVLAAVSIVQIIFLTRADQTARTAADAALVTAKTTITQASHLERSTAEAARAATAMQNVAAALDKQATITHQGYLATHRPRLTARFITCAEPVVGHRPSAEVRVANVGYTDAKITGIGADIFLRSFKRIVSGGFSAIPQPIPDNPLVEPSQEVVFTVTGGNPLSEYDVICIADGQQELCLIGIVVYEDHNGTKRTTSFFRTYDTQQKRFVRSAPSDVHSDYEYEN